MKRASTACFFARVPSPDVIGRTEFYAQDVRALEDLGYDVRVVTRMRELARAPRCDLYFVWWWTRALPVVALARSAHRPVVVTGTLDVNAYAATPRWRRRVIDLALRHASANVFVSEMELRDIPALVPGTRRPRYSPHTVDAVVYSPPDTAAKRDPGLLFAVCWLQGGNPARKGLPETIRALPLVAERHPDVRLLVAGERGSAYRGLCGLARSAGVRDRVEFLGPVPREEKVRLMRECALYVQPSRYEGFGLAILEAMACGAAVVTRRAGAVPEVGGDAVRYVDTLEPEDLAGHVSQLLSDPTARADMGCRAAVRARSLFPYERRRDELARVIAEVSA